MAFLLEVLSDFFTISLTVFTISAKLALPKLPHDKIALMAGHLYEITHQYRGPLDFVIPYIIREYKNTEDLVIATNYEEGAYIYYLGSKTILGYTGANLEEDIKLTPDIIIFRRRFAYTNDPKIFDGLAGKGGEYMKVSFPVFDYNVNNIPEPGWHLFATPAQTTEENRLNIYVRKNLPISG